MKVTQKIRHLCRCRFGHRLLSSTAADRIVQGPWITRDLINKRPVLVIDFKELENESSNVARSDSGGEKQGLETARLTDFRQLASFNWYGSPVKPIIIIPGAPSYFRGSWTGDELKPDKRESILSSILYMMPHYPMESLFLAVEKCTTLDNLPRTKFSNFDIAADRGVIRKLFEFCRLRGHYPRRSDNILMANAIGARIDVERLGERLVVFSRREPSLYYVPASFPKKTFGLDYRLQMTEMPPLFMNSASNRLLQLLTAASPECSIPISTHYHVASFRFGKLNVLSRFHVECVDIGKSEPVGAPVDESEYAIDSVDGSNLSCIYAGQRHRYFTMELTTRNVGKPFPRRIWQQLYFSQTNALSIGWYHHHGDSANRVVPQLYSLEECRKLAMEERIIKFGYNEATLDLLHKLLLRVVDFVQCQPNGKKFSLIWSPKFSPQLRIYEKTDNSLRALPDYLLKDIV